jgi:hypothetical protein
MVAVYLTLELFDRGGSGGDFSDGTSRGAAALRVHAAENLIEGQ